MENEGVEKIQDIYIKKLDKLEKKYKNVYKLLKEAYDHLNYCNYGDSWERECAESLQKKLDRFFNN
jgi:hypothetical protein